MSSEILPPISAEAVAAKLEQIANFQQPVLFEELAEQPRLAEVLWFLQFVSHPDNYPGGLARFAHDFISQANAEIGTSQMVLCREGGQPLTFEQVYAVYHEFSASAQETMVPRHLRVVFDPSKAESIPASKPSRAELAKLSRDERAEFLALYDEDVAGRAAYESDKAAAVAMLTRQRLMEICAEVARENLGAYFKRLCEQPEVTFRRRGSRDWHETGTRAPWYFVNVAQVLLAFIDRRKAALSARIAATEITKLVFEWMSVSHETGRGVLIEGNSRFGKTEAIKLWCDMNPGIARLVNTPATNAIGDLLREVARTLGIDSAPGRRGHDLRERIEYVLRFSKLLLCFDESNFLLPGSYSKSTAPARLNWVRRSIMDRKSPAVFVYTPQNNAPAKSRFVKATGYEMAQFDERVFTVKLPVELSEDDLLAVARIHFRELPELHLQYVVKKAQATERNYISDIEKIATLANYKAKANGRALPVLADINVAIASVLPVARASIVAAPIAAPGALVTAAPRPRVAPTRRKPCTRVAEPLQTSRITFTDSAERAENESTELVKT